MLGWTDTRGKKPGGGWPVQYGTAARLLVHDYGKGFPKQAEVEAVLGWTDARGKKPWEVDGRFSMELFRTFSSMNSGKGLPKKAEVEAVLGWTDGRARSSEVDGQFSMELFRAFSSMTHSKGLPKQAEVEAVLGWTDARARNSGKWMTGLVWSYYAPSRL